MPKVTLESGRSSATDPAKAAEEALASLGPVPPKVVFGFVPGPFDHGAFHKALRERLPKHVRVCTSSTGGEIDRSGYLTHHLVVAALGGDIEIGAGIGTALARDAASAGSKAIERAASELGTTVGGLDRRCGAIVIDDGFKMKKEEMLLGVLEKNQGLVVVGGGASGYEFMRGEGSVGVDGEVVTDGVLIVTFRTPAPWAALRSHWYLPTGRSVRVTKVDVAARRILELDGKPAGARWAEVAGVPPEHLTLTKPDKFLEWALAMKVGREHFLRAIAKRLEDDTLESTNMVQDDQELEVMRAGDIVELTRRFFDDELPRRIERPSAALLFDCGARKLYAQMTGRLGELGAVLGGKVPSAGFTVQFETYCGFMINSTLTSLVFGES
jgi:hypothetical protein